VKDNKLRIEVIPLDKLDANVWNPNVVPDDVMKHLEREYDRVGFLQPILVRQKTDGRYETIDGEHRAQALRTAKATTVHAVVVEMTDQEAKLTTINMNRIKGAEDPFKLSEMLKNLMTELDLASLSETLNMSEHEIETLLDIDDLLVEKTTGDNGRKFIVVPDAMKPGDKIYLDDVEVFKDEPVKKPVPTGEKE